MTARLSPVPPSPAGGPNNPKQKQSGYERDSHDWYVDPAWCSELLFSEITFSGNVYDPACGCGTILTVAESFGLHVIGCDIVNRGWNYMFEPQDFLAPCAGARLRPANIVTNPPYKLAEAFARRALDLARNKVAILVRLDFLASQRRHKLFTEHPPAYVLVLSRRPSMPPGGRDLPAKGGMHDFCWIVWDHEHCREGFMGETIIRWLK